MSNSPNEIQTRFPSVIPFEKITIEQETHTYRVLDNGTATTKYVLDKAPVVEIRVVSGFVDGATYEFEQGTDYTTVDDSGDGDPDAIEFDTGNGIRPDDNTEFTVTYVAVSVIERYIGSYQQEFDDLNDLAEYVIESRQVDNATGRDLDEIGKFFGRLGKRRGRTDQEYRTFLRSIANSFAGRGTVSGIRFAVASGYGGDVDDITIKEDFQTNSYSIRFEDPWPDHSLSILSTLAELADPSGVGIGGFEYELESDVTSLSDDVFDRVVATNTDLVRWDAGIYDQSNWDDDTPGDKAGAEDDVSTEMTVKLSQPYQWNVHDYDTMVWDTTTGREKDQLTTISDTVTESLTVNGAVLADTSNSTDTVVRTANKTDRSATDGSISSDSILVEQFALRWQEDTWSGTHWSEKK